MSHTEPDPWPEGVRETQCWLCHEPPVYHDILGIGWCRLHYDRAYLEGRHDLPD
jgi:hypothetical protein